ncbi:MAG: hypothetical protein JSR36_08395 [Proteobacteria bacterium]|nr:hypothetical protein [Pseudomonadota bacterium]
MACSPIALCHREGPSSRQFCGFTQLPTRDHSYCHDTQVRQRKHDTPLGNGQISDRVQAEPAARPRREFGALVSITDPIAFGGIFADRAAAGVALARKLRPMMAGRPAIILALPRGGVPVAYEVACALDAPLDVMLVRKVGLPGHDELAMGALASGGIVVHDEHLAKEIPRFTEIFDQVAARELRELNRRERTYHSRCAALDLKGKTAVLVDDGLATGSTMLAAIRATRKNGAATIIVAAPVASPEAAALVANEADATVILETPAALMAIGAWYYDFTQLKDADVIRLLTLSRSKGKQVPIAARTEQDDPAISGYRRTDTDT